MAQNPFRYGSPVGDPYFVGRARELDVLLDRMGNGINVVVTAPRRYGKTSLLERAADRLAGDGGSVLRANLLLTPSFESLAGRLTTEAYELPGGAWRRAVQAIPEYLRRLRLHPTVGVDDTGRPVFSFAGGLQAADAGQLLEDVYALLAEVAEERPVALLLDEFQAVADLDRALPGRLKALADAHPRVALVMAGSTEHLMESLVLARGAPLYQMAERLALGPIDQAEMAGFLRARSRVGGKPMTPGAAGRIRDLAGPIPYDIQRLAYEVFASAASAIDEGAVEDGLARVVAHEAESHAERFSRFSLGQRRALVVLAADGGTTRPQSAAFARATGYANPAGSAKALRSLAADETVVRRSGTWLVADPFFREWLRQSG
ncbi:MAG: AAA family ATPase [Acidimicrobiales bacterium]